MTEGRREFFPLTKQAFRDMADSFKTRDMKLVGFSIVFGLFCLPFTVVGDLRNNGEPVNVFEEK